jgi:serine O-acetyltransferase
MITSWDDYLKYLEADRVALNVNGTIKDRLLNDIWRFERLMRKCEYLKNCRKSRVRRFWSQYRYMRAGRTLGFSIPLNVSEPGLSIAHRGTIVVNSGARIDANCRLHVGVNIGTLAGKSHDAPTIGDNCYIGPGAKLFGPIVLGDNVVVGANAVVNKSFPEGNVTIGGIPARMLSDKGSARLLIKGWDC